MGQGEDGPLEMERETPEDRGLVDDMRVSYVLRRRGGPRVLFGYRKKGTSVP